MPPSLEQFPPHSTRQLYLLLHRRSMPQEKTLSKISLKGQKMQNWQVLHPNPVAHLFIIREILVIFCSFAAKASLSLSVGKLLFFVLSSLKQDPNITPSRQDFPGFLISNVRGRFFGGVRRSYPLKNVSNPRVLSEISRISTPPCLDLHPTTGRCHRVSPGNHGTPDR